jgi:hypothetical protein
MPRAFSGSWPTCRSEPRLPSPDRPALRAASSEVDRPPQLAQRLPEPHSAKRSALGALVSTVSSQSAGCAPASAGTNVRAANAAAATHT